MENDTPKKGFFRKPWVQSVIGIVVIALALTGFLYWRSVSGYVAIDTSQILAPVIAISPETEGILDEVYVKPGDAVVANQTVARVGSEILSAKTNGIVITVNNTPGQVFMAGSAVASMIDPTQLRVVGTIDEDKGLSSIKVGDPAFFTVDAFGTKKFTGVVDEISPTSNQSNAVFTISDKREVRQFDIKVRFDTAQYPEFKNGMSAKLRIYGTQ